MKNENLFQKSSSTVCFLVKNAKIENATFLYKTALLKQMLKQIAREAENGQKTKFCQELLYFLGKILF